jgi:hypothetical protein
MTRVAEMYPAPLWNFVIRSPTCAVEGAPPNYTKMRAEADQK